MKTALHHKILLSLILSFTLGLLANFETKELEAKVLDYVSKYEVEEEESEGVVNKYNYLVERGLVRYQN